MYFGQFLCQNMSFTCNYRLGDKPNSFVDRPIHREGLIVLRDHRKDRSRCSMTDGSLQVHDAFAEMTAVLVMNVEREPLFPNS
jgi:hypothetical protein